MGKKAQIQIGETIAVLFVFFILVAIGFIFYTKFIKSNIESEKEELSQLRSVEIAQRVMFMPELQCSEDNIVRDNCIDILKLDAAKNIMNLNELYYFDLLEFSDISISQVYPPNPAVYNLNIYSKKIKDFKSNFTTNVPISLYNPVTKNYMFGVLSIETLLK